MAGHTAYRKLGTDFALATREDDGALRRLLRETPIDGIVDVGFEREPAYFRSTDLAGGDDQTIVAFSGGEMVCMGRCTHRQCWVDGVPRRVGYLAELRLAHAARGRFRILRDGYEFFQKLQEDHPADLYFSSIAADNLRARRLLEFEADELPVYRYLSKLDTVLVAVPRHSRGRTLQLARATPEHLPDLLRILNAHGKRTQLAAVWTAEMLTTLDAHGLPLSSISLAISEGNVVGCAGLWDQRSFHQTVIHRYPQPLATARPLLNLLSPLFGTPRLPAPGSTLAQAFLSPLAFVDGAEALLPDLIASLFPQAREAGIDFLTLALPTDDPRLAAIRRRFSTRTWLSRLHGVEWPGSTQCVFQDQSLRVLPEVALL